MKYRFLPITLFMAVFLSPVKARHSRPAISKMAPWVLAQTATGEKAEFFVVLADQADLSGAAALKTKQEKGEYVYRALWSKAQQTQGPILEWLERNKVEHRSFYIVNAILVTGDRGVATELAARSDVDRIEGNPRVQNVQPSPVPEAKSALRPQAIEDNITFTRAPEVWAEGFTGQGVVIASADTGFLRNHTALKTHYRGGAGKDAVDDFNWHDSIHSHGGVCGPDSPTPCDDFGHGTYTVGIAVGDDGAGNQIGIAPGAKWIGCRNMDQGTGSPASYMECFEFFLAPYPVGGTPAQGDPSKAPDLTTNSWGCPPSEGCSPLTLQAAIEAARAAGIVTVVAAGNHTSADCSSIVDPPSLYEAAFVVGAVDHLTGLIASFSDRGPITVDGSNRLKPDITAPGVSVRSSYFTDTTSYARFNGTSDSAPHVAGAVALMLSAQPLLRGNVAAIETILKSSAVPVPSTDCSSSGSPNNTYGYGRLDAKAAVDMALPGFAPLSAVFTPAGGNGSVNVSISSALTWVATSSVPWITVNSGSGTRNGTASFVVAINQGSAARAGSIRIAGRDFAVRQQGSGAASCSFAVNADFRKVKAAGGAQSVMVVAPDGCLWTATSSVDWITITSDNGGLGNGTVTFTVSPNNTGSLRKGSIDVSGTTFTLKQKG